LRYRFIDGATLDDLLDRLTVAPRQGAITGPHGSGKSTLLAAICAGLVDRGWQVIAYELHDGQRRLPGGLPATASQRTFVVVDGYEQLSWFATWRLRRHCRRHGRGLLVTSHAPTRLPTLYRTQASLALARQLVDELQRGEIFANLIAAADVEPSFALHHGNLRELLFSMYALYEQRRRHDR
jgi:ABC-type branched-subunit amino acid transport system ATPase component